MLLRKPRVGSPHGSDMYALNLSTACADLQAAAAAVPTLPPLTFTLVTASAGYLPTSHFEITQLHDGRFVATGVPSGRANADELLPPSLPPMTPWSCAGLMPCRASIAATCGGTCIGAWSGGACAPGR